MRNIVLMEVHERTQQLLHDAGGLFLCQMLAVENEMEQLASLAVPVIK